MIEDASDRFESLPAGIRSHYHHNAIVNYYVQHYLAGYFTREELLINLCCTLANQNAALTKDLVELHQKSVFPPIFIPGPPDPKG